MKNTRLLLERRKKRNRNFLKKKLNGKLRLTVFRSNNHIYCQIIDDDKAKTLLSSSKSINDDDSLLNCRISGLTHKSPDLIIFTKRSFLKPVPLSNIEMLSKTLDLPEPLIP